MIIDNETFTEVTFGLKYASDAVLKAAKYISEVTEEEFDDSNITPIVWTHIIEILMSINSSIFQIERLLRATLDANYKDCIKVDLPN